MYMYERTAFFSRVVPANSIAKVYAQFLPLLMRMYNWYSDDPDPTFFKNLYFYSREPIFHTMFPPGNHQYNVKKVQVIINK